MDLRKWMAPKPDQNSTGGGQSSPAKVTPSKANKSKYIQSDSSDDEVVTISKTKPQKPSQSADEPKSRSKASSSASNAPSGVKNKRKFVASSSSASSASSSSSSSGSDSDSVSELSEAEDFEDERPRKKKPAAAASRAKATKTAASTKPPPAKKQKTAAADPATNSTASSKPPADPAAKSAKQAAFLKFKLGMSSGPPPLAGLRPSPNGSANCLGWGGGGPKSKLGPVQSNPAPLTFVITGTLRSLERTDCENLIKRYGGRCTSAVSGKTDYLISGTDAGESKAKKAADLGIPVVTEDGLFQLIVDRSPGVSQPRFLFPETDDAHELRQLIADSVRDSPPPQAAAAVSPSATTVAGAPSAVATPAPAPADAPKKGSLYARKTPSSTTSQPSPAASVSTTTTTTTTTSTPQQAVPTTSSYPRIATYPGTSLDDLWVDRYKPISTRDIIGNTTTVQSIVSWLQEFPSHYGPTATSKASATTTTGRRKSAAASDSFPRAILLSGAPGIGKTSSAILCCQAAGFTPVEFNASDTRNKNSIQDEIGVLSKNKTLTQFFGAKKTDPSDSSSSAAAARAISASKGHQATKATRGSVIIMDECDGVSASDRGGMAALINIIKETTTPIICICNDASSDKVKSLKNYCQAYSWRRPLVPQITARMMAIAHQEGLFIDQPTMTKIIEATHSDLRAILNALQILAKTRRNTTVSWDDGVSFEQENKKDFDIGVYEVIPQLFHPGYRPNWVNDFLDMFFIDPNIVPLFIQENYLRASPVISLIPPTARSTFAATLKPTSTTSKPFIATLQNPKLPTKLSNEAKHMLITASASDFISQGEVVGGSIMQDQNFALQPLYGLLSTVCPGQHYSGLRGMLEFPKILGKMSSTNKSLRLTASLRTAIAPVASMLSSITFTTQYLSALHRKIIAIASQKVSLTQELLVKIYGQHYCESHTGRLHELMTGYTALAHLLAVLSIVKDDWNDLMSLCDNIMVSPDMTYASSISSGDKAKMTRLLNDIINSKLSRGSAGGRAAASPSARMVTEDEELAVANHDATNEEDDENGGDDDDDDVISPTSTTTATKGKKSTATKKSTSKK